MIHVMKKVSCIVLFAILFLSGSIQIRPRTSESEKISVTPAISDYGGYPEEAFYPLYLNPADIVMGEPILESGGSRVDCSINISYPETNNTWLFIFPSNYADATEYYIRRTATEYYYPEEDANLTQAHYEGETTHWIIDGSLGVVDTLHFTLLLPTPIIELDQAQSSYDIQVLDISISRDDLAPRPYANVKLAGEAVLTYTDFIFTLQNLTGGIEENITDSADFTYYFRTSTYGQTLVFTINLGDIRNKTDYQFLAIFAAKPAPRSFLTDWVINIVAPLFGGFFAGVGLAPYMWQYAFKDVRRGRWRSREYIRKGIPFGALCGGVCVLIFYLLSL